MSIKLFLECVGLSVLYAGVSILVGSIAYCMVCSIVPAIQWIL